MRQNIHRGGELLVDRVMELVAGREAESEVLPTDWWCGPPAVQIWITSPAANRFPIDYLGGDAR